MTTSAKSVHEFFNEETFFDNFSNNKGSGNIQESFNSPNNLIYSPISVESVALSPNETPSPNNTFSLPEKRKVSSPDSDLEDNDSRKNSNSSEIDDEGSSKAIKAEISSTVSSSKAAAAAAAKSARAGRKPQQNEPENKRKAQNRAAQRAFRERKEKHLKELEDRVLELENEATSTSNENNFLRLQVERLQEELRKYRQTTKSTSSASKNTVLLNQDLGPSATVGGSSTKNNSTSSSTSSTVKPFTFEFPFFSSADGKKSANNGMHSLNTAGSIGKSAVLGSMDSSAATTRRSTNIESPFGSISSASPTSNASNSPNEIRRTSSLTEPQPDEFCDQLSLACGTKDHPVPKAGGSAKGSPVVITASSIPWTSSASPQPTTNSHNSGSNIHSAALTSSSSARTPSSSFGAGLFSPSEFDVDFISEYRDPLFDGEQFTLPELATSEYSMFDPLENPIANTAFEMLNKNAVFVKEEVSPPTNNNNSNNNNNNNNSNFNNNTPLGPTNDDDETVPAYPSKLMNCTAVWDRICQHPKFGDIDIDGLCHELRAKAKCSETGVLLTEKDVDKVLKSFS